MDIISDVLDELPQPLHERHALLLQLGFHHAPPGHPERRLQLLHVDGAVAAVQEGGDRVAR